MASSKSKPELIVIVGPTASGKSELALRLAQKYDGEIISADSRTIYKDADIGTSKPSNQDRKSVPHWGLDLIEPGQRYSAKAYKEYALAKIADIKSRSRIAILVGGTGLYIDSVLFDYEFRPRASQPRRRQLEAKTLEQLQEMIAAKGYKLPRNLRNKRHLIRAIESAGADSQPGSQPLQDYLLVGLNPPKSLHQARIAARAEAMFKTGVLAETQKLEKKYGQRAAAELGIIYKICQDLLANKLAPEEAINLFKTRDWQYSRRQRTWLKRNKKILWCSSTDEAEVLVDKVMNT